MSAAGDREQYNADPPGRLDRRAAAISLSAPPGKPRAHMFPSGSEAVVCVD
jgi:hypothetical protein